MMMFAITKLSVTRLHVGARSRLRHRQFKAELWFKNTRIGFCLLARSLQHYYVLISQHCCHAQLAHPWVGMHPYLFSACDKFLVYLSYMCT